MSQEDEGYGDDDFEKVKASDKDEYDDDNFENEEKESETQMLEVVSYDQVEARFQEMKYIFQIKNIKKGEILKYILHG